MDFELKIIGSSSATPTPDRHPTAQVLTIGNQLHLIDCGEGTQMQLMRYKVKPQRIVNIYISHLHGDHYFGLFGLLSTMHLQHRTQSLRLFGPADLAELLTLQFKCSHTQLAFPLSFHALDTTVYQQIFEDQFITVHTLPMRHRIACCGFLFREKPKPRSLIKEKLSNFLTPPQLMRLKSGGDLLDAAGTVLVPNAAVTSDPKRSRSYAYCADTRYQEELIPCLRHVDLLYHEATFLDELRDRAHDTFHSTARQAATLALHAEVKHLLIGHFSVRYRDLTPLLLEAKAVFANTQLATEGKTVGIVE